MGLLDDAIREHLELKRKHGASEEELEQAEQEALTPARRDPTAGAGVPPVEEVPGAPVQPLAEGELPPPPPPPPTEAEVDLEPELDADEVPVEDQPTMVQAPAPPADPDAPEPAIPPSALGDEEDDYLA